jgi:hypothetical protein
MKPSSPPEAQEPRPVETPEQLEERLRRGREERVRKSLAALDRDRFGPLSSASGGQMLMRVVVVVVAFLTLWALWVRLNP